MENNKYYVSTADLIKLMNDVMNADKNLLLRLLE